MQKALYPEGDAVCHAVVIHPPGGIAGGDALELNVTVEPGAHALITTPGAAKWYKANGRVASQHVRLAVDGVLEWLPQEAIVFDAAEVRSSIDIDLAADATMIGWDIVALGRRAAGERYSRGCFAQTIRLSIGGELTWIERTRIAGGDALLDAPVGLAGHHVFGCLWAAGSNGRHRHRRIAHRTRRVRSRRADHSARARTPGGAQPWRRHRGRPRRTRCRVDRIATACLRPRRATTAPVGHLSARTDDGTFPA